MIENLDQLMYQVEKLSTKIINGRLSGKTRVSRGLRDLISTLVFIRVAGVLSWLIERGCDLGLVEVGRYGRKM